MLNNTFKYKKVYIILIIIFSITIFTSCSKNPKDEENNKEPIPQELKTIAKNTEKILEETEKLQEIISNPDQYKEEETSQNSETQKPQNSEEQESKKSDTENAKETNKDGNTSNETTDDEDKDAEEVEKEKNYNKLKEDSWKIINEKSMKIHSEWNSLELASIDNGSSKIEIDEFEKSINNLTVAINARKDMDALFMANDVLLNASIFFNKYKGNYEGDMYKIKYYVRMSLLNGQTDEWEKAKKNVQDAQPLVESFSKKVKLEEKNQKLLEKLKLSVNDMLVVINDNDKDLLEIKRNIVLKNISEIVDKSK